MVILTHPQHQAHPSPGFLVLHTVPAKMSPAPTSGKDSGAARILGSGTSGALARSCRVVHFPPVDTVAKRLMSNQAKVLLVVLCDSGSSTLSAVIFRCCVQAYRGEDDVFVPGLGYAAGYKVAQRVYKFGGQPYFNDLINKHYKTQFTNTFGERKGKDDDAGCCWRVLLPLDVLKIKRQVNPEAFRGRGTSLYRGWGWTMARNAPGSFALFGASAVTKEYVLGVEDYSKATWGQNFIASIAGAVASITVAAPLDVVKTRIQNANFERKVSGVTVVKELIKNEGPTAFFKG
ncbi:mitochondrial carrier protein [Coprinopsis sp. MPI-PUGE-AT-0042]|nr:mitochondrial carrier protein [Coprinopsis sp. MPI-PUGE-AT-0042]